MSAAPELADRRGLIYANLKRRNRRIGWLRIGVPILGALVLLVLLGQIIIANIASQILPQGVRIAQDKVIIDAPAYSGVMLDGTRYTITSEEATASVKDTDLVDLTNAHIELMRPSGQEVIAESATAQFSFSDQKVHVPGVMFVTDSDGAGAQLRDSVIDWATQTMDSRGRVEVVFSDGTILTGSSLYYDATTETWDFAGVTLTVPESGEGQ